MATTTRGQTEGGADVSTDGHATTTAILSRLADLADESSRLLDGLGELADLTASGTASGVPQAFRGAVARRGGVISSRLAHQNDRLGVRVAAELSATAGHLHDASTTPARWLERHLGIRAGEARRLVRVAKLLETVPSLCTPFATGRINIGHLDAIARIVPSRVRGEERDFMWQAVSESAGELVGAAAGCDVARFEEFCDRVRDRLDVDGPGDPAHDPSRVWLSKGFRGRWVLRGDLSADDGALLAQIVDERTRRLLRHDADDEPATSKKAASVEQEGLRHEPSEGHELSEDQEPPEGDEASASEERSIGAQKVVMSEVRARALGQLCLDGAGARAPGRVGVFLHLDLADLGPEAGPVRARLGTGIDISEGSLWSLLADADARPVFCDGGEPLSYGRSRRLAPDILRRILEYRDRHCCVPGCGVPPVWHDAHHLMHWEHGGTTDPATIKGVCGRHHRGHHDGQWRIERSPDTGEVAVRRPDDTPIEETPHWSRNAEDHDPIRQRVLQRLCEARPPPRLRRR